MAFLKISTSRKCSQLLLQEPLRNDVYARLVRSLTTNANGSAEQHQQRRNSSVVSGPTAGVVDAKPKWDQLDTSFANPEATFKSKTTWEIFRAYIVYQLCSSSYLVENNMQLMKLCKAVFGEKLFTLMMKMTFYGHFVAGEDQYRIVPTLKRLRSFGVKPILDYSVEEDISQEEAEKREVE
uniref:Proline dehydrogenase n=3 Tax=Aphidini TaxID=33387 RepID=A0A2S2NW35_SCHGA